VKTLRVLVANERQDRLVDVAAVVSGLGHEVIAPQIEVSEVGLVTAREQPDVAFVGLGESSAHALELIEQIVHESACPVVALLHAPDHEFVLEAAKRGVFAYITDGEPQEWQNSIEIVLRRFADFRDLEGAFKRRSITERAKGILMERHTVDEERAFGMLRDHARGTKSTLVETAESVVNGSLLLPVSS
jgi:AmiR/NasT family two-component response regulator